MAKPNEVKQVAVIGAGTIGASWTAHFLAQGMRVAVSDPNPAAEAYLRRFVADAWPTLEALGLAPGAAPDRWSFHTTPQEAVRGAHFVQENAPERAPVKRELYAALEDVLEPDAILASSSSGLIMSELQEGLRTPGRFAIGHPFNPPHLIPLVEVVGGRQTTPETIQWCLDFYNGIGKKAIHIRKEAPGHLANRLQAALVREAMDAVASGLASVEDVDTAITAGPGLRWAIMGPHMTLHLGGGEGGYTHMLAQFGPVFEGWWQTMRTPEITDDLRRQLIEGVNREAEGRSIAELAAERDRLLVEMMRMIGRK